jgi:uncharacterized protein (TIGR02453 family)
VPTASTGFTGFRPAALTFFRGLARHNDKAWFEDHREAWEREVRDPMRALVEEVDDGLARLAPELLGDPKRSLFRLHRDTRFSKDKKPFKTNAACQFFHQGAGRGAGQSAATPAAGLYFQLAPGDCLVAAGIWMPPPPALVRLRDALAEDPTGFARLVRAAPFKRAYGALDTEAMLVRMPRGYAEDHPAAAWLRYRSFTVARVLPDAQVLGPGLPRLLLRHFTPAIPFVRWLNTALGHPPRDRRW